MPELRDYQKLSRGLLIELCERLRGSRKRVVRAAAESRGQIAYLYSLMGVKRTELVRRLMRAEELRRGARAQCQRHLQRILELEKKLAEAKIGVVDEPSYEVEDVPGKPWMRRIWRIGALWECDVPTEQVKYKLQQLQEGEQQ